MKYPSFFIRACLAAMVFISCSKEPEIPTATYPPPQETPDNPPAPSPTPPMATPGVKNPFRQENIIGQLSSARSNMASAICNGKLFFAGGVEAGLGYSDAVDIFDPTTNTLESTDHLSLARWGVQAVAAGDKVFFAGGFTGEKNTPSSRIDIYDAISRTWTTAELSLARFEMALAAVGNKVFFAGGASIWPAGDPNETHRISSRVDIYDLLSKTWTTAELSEPRKELTAAVTGNKIVFAGGRNNSVEGASSIVDIYDAQTNNWTTKNLSSPAIGLSSIVVNGKAYFSFSYFGLADTFLEIFDAGTNSWSILKLAEGKVYIPIGTSNGKIAFIGGMLGWFNHSKLIEILDTETKTWTYTYMEEDLMWESILSFDNYIYSAGGTISGGDVPVATIYKFQL